MDFKGVLTICNLIRFPSSSIVLILKSIPMVVMNEGVQASSQNRRSRQDLPTPIHSNYYNPQMTIREYEPESPMRRSFMDNIRDWKIVVRDMNGLPWWESRNEEEAYWMVSGDGIIEWNERSGACIVVGCLDWTAITCLLMFEFGHDVWSVV